MIGVTDSGFDDAWVKYQIALVKMELAEFKRSRQRVLFKKLHPDAIIPKKQREGDAAYDLYASQNCYLTGVGSVPTGIACAIPDGYVGIVKGRSGLALEAGIQVLGGVIDSNYRGEIKVILKYDNPPEIAAYSIIQAQRIAQLLVVPIHTLGWAEVDTLPENNVRGEQGFGSSGV